MSDGTHDYEKTMAMFEKHPEYVFRCSAGCGAETKNDHEGNGCHSCGRGAMRKEIK